jgi:hypothetical protein
MNEPLTHTIVGGPLDGAVFYAPSLVEATFSVNGEHAEYVRLEEPSPNGVRLEHCTTKGCCVCGLPGNVVQLVRMTWVDDGKARWNEEFDWRELSVVVAKVEKPNDSLVCVDCIRGIKRLPFSDLAEVQS